MLASIFFQQPVSAAATRTYDPLTYTSADPVFASCALSDAFSLALVVATTPMDNYEDNYTAGSYTGVP